MNITSAQSVTIAAVLLGLAVAIPITMRACKDTPTNDVLPTKEPYTIMLVTSKCAILRMIDDRGQVIYLAQSTEYNADCALALGTMASARATQ